MGISVIYNNFISIFPTAHLRTLPELGQSQELNTANEHDTLDLSIFIPHCRTRKQTNPKAQYRDEFAIPHTS